jgi:demethylmenaquinone methyltransferase/2-methoxy-6-polyprenyl-1,4-benzoquinol methylase
MAAQARAKGLRVAAANVLALPFASESVDKVLVVDAFHHFVYPSPARAQSAGVAELLRVVKPGGRLLIEEPDITQPGTQWVVRMERVLLMGSHFLAPADLRRLFESQGAELLAEERDNGSVRQVYARSA